MDVQTYDATHELADVLLAELQRLYREKKLTAVEDKLKEISASLPKGHSITVNFSVAGSKRTIALAPNITNI